MAEAHHLLAQYRLSQESNNFGMDSIDSNLALLTPSALVIQAYKICCGLIRNPNPHVSGLNYGNLREKSFNLFFFSKDGLIFVSTSI